MNKKRMSYGYKITKPKDKELIVFNVVAPMSLWRAIRTAWVLWRKSGMWAYLIAEVDRRDIK